MIGQKTLYSFFSPCPAGKRRARSPEPAHPGTGVATVAEESGNAAVRRGGDRVPGARDGEEGDGTRSAEGLQGRASDLVSRVPMFKADCTCSKQPAQFSVGGHSEGPANGDGSRGPRRQSEGEGPPSSARRPIRGERGRTHPPRVLPRKDHVGTRGGGASGSGPPFPPTPWETRRAFLTAPLPTASWCQTQDWGQRPAFPDRTPRVRFYYDLPVGAAGPRMGVLRHGPWGWGRQLWAPGRGPLQTVTRLCGDHLQASPPKKARAVQEDPGTPPSSPLSPEQLVRIQRNKAAALLRLAARNVPVGFGESWKKPLSAEFGKPYFIKLMGFVAEERKHYTVYPPPHQVFTWTQMCDIRQVKVVILGQDPYHGPNQAHGLCFSVQRPVPPPPSLENIYKELSTDIDGFVHPGHGDLSGWAKQGVLLLNAVLTVRAHQANSHKERGWEQFTDAVVSWLNQNSSGLVFLLWGSYAQKKGSAIDRKRHHVLQTAHPSPLSVYRGFFGCRHFSKTNELLRKSGKEPINWKDL